MGSEVEKGCFHCFGIPEPEGPAAISKSFHGGKVEKKPVGGGGIRVHMGHREIIMCYLLIPRMSIRKRIFEKESFDPS